MNHLKGKIFFILFLIFSSTPVLLSQVVYEPLHRDVYNFLRRLSQRDIIEFNDNDTEVFGLIQAELEKKGEIIGPYDMQIAAQSISRNLILVTNNTSEFSRISNIRLENWV